MINVTIKNKLGEQFGQKALHVKVNGTSVAGSPILPFNEITFTLSGTFPPMEVVALEVDDVPLNATVLYPAPISQSSPSVAMASYPLGKARKWELVFLSLPDNLGFASFGKSTPENTNVTIGADEPAKKISRWHCISTVAFSFAIGLGVSPFIKEASPVLWGVLIGLSGIVGVIAGVIAYKENTSGQEFTPKEEM